MALSDFLSNIRYYFDHQPTRTAVKSSVGQLGAGALRRITPHLPHPGTPIMKLDWEVLVVLDACRPEALREVKDEYDFFPSAIDVTYSQASASAEWMQSNFTAQYADEMARTAHVTANPNSASNMCATDWDVLDEVWRTGYDSERELIPPRPVTDRAVSMWRRRSTRRMIVHYIPPHQPYPGFAPEGEDSPRLTPYEDTPDDRGVFNWLIEGKVTREEVWEAYLDTLRWVLDDVELLLENLDSDNVVITADHAELFGELGLYGHPIWTWVPALLRVPYVRVPATDEQTHTPDVDLTDDGGDGNPTKQLRALGYR